MAGYILITLGVVAALLESTHAVNCSIAPLYVDIHRREVHGADQFQYGSFVGIGSPAQNQSIWPSLRQNETSFAASNFCSNSSLTNCNYATGGNFDPAQSTSWTSDNGNETTSISSNDGSFLKGTDTLHMYTHYFMTSPASERLIDQAPVVIGTGGSKNPGILGLGSASTILQKLYDTGMIAARTYSLYIGTGFDRAGGIMNGSNVFGGYDSGRFVEPIHTYKMDLSQPDYLPVTVSDIIIDNKSDPSKGQISIMDDGAFEARITTDRYPMLLPPHVMHKFIAATGASPHNSTDNSLRMNPERPFNGTMTIKLSDGFNITLPASTLANISGLTPIEATPPDYTGPFYLSASWLSQVYLMLDFDTAQFHLAQVLPIAQYIIPQTLCPNSLPIAHDYSKPAVPYFRRQGVIGGIIGGVVFGLALLAAGTWLFLAWKRRKAAAAQQQRWDAEEKAMAMTTPSDVEMQRLTPTLLASPAFPPAAQTPQTYHPLEQLRDLTPSPVSAVSSLEGEVMGSRPHSLRRGSAG